MPTTPDKGECTLKGRSRFFFSVHLLFCKPSSGVGFSYLLFDIMYIIAIELNIPIASSIAILFSLVLNTESPICE